MSPRALGLLAAAVGSVGLIGLTLGAVLDATRPRTQVASEQIVNVTAAPIAVGQGSAAATALAAQLASAGGAIITLNHAVEVPAGQAVPVREVVLLHSCVGSVSRDHCTSSLLSFPPGEQPPLTGAGQLLLRGVFRVSTLVDEQYGPGFLLQAAR